VIPSNPAQQRNPYLEWDGVVFVIGGIFAAMLVLKQLLEFGKSIGEFLDRKKKSALEQDAPLAARIAAVEDVVKSFRTRDDLERDFGILKGDIRHIKANSEQSNQSSADRFRKIEGQLTEDRLERARLEAKVDGMSVNFARVEGAVERLGERVEDRLDKMQELITLAVTARSGASKRTTSSND
jgi:hypothetical protein